MSVASAAALLLALTSSPLRPLHSKLAPPRIFPLSLGRSARLPGVSHSDFADIGCVRFFPVKALPSGNEEEEPDSTSRPACWFFEACPSHSVHAWEKLASIGTVRLLHPLRC